MNSGNESVNPKGWAILKGKLGSFEILEIVEVQLLFFQIILYKCSNMKTYYQRPLKSFI